MDYSNICGYGTKQPASVDIPASWKNIYELDLSAEANMTGVIGANVIDALTWYGKGSLAAGGNAYTINLVNGLGLGVQQTTAVASTGLGTSGALTVPHWFLPLSAVPDYSATQPLLIRGRFKFSGATCQGAMGLCSSTNDGTGLIAGDRQYDHFIGNIQQATTTPSLASKDGVSQYLATAGTKRDGTSLREECVYGILTKSVEGRGDYAGSENLVAGMPAATGNFFPMVPGSLDAFYTAALERPNPGLFFAMTVSPAAVCGAYLEAIQFFQHY